MRWLVLLLCVGSSVGRLWKNGVVHFSISQKDYDVHSQDIILSTFKEIQDDICIKFFNTPLNYNTSDQILYITNPDKVKNCLSNSFDYSKKVLDMVIGYKCLNKKDIAKMVVDMLRASILEKAPIQFQNFDLMKKFQVRKSNNTQLISQVDRNYINAHYNEECLSLMTKVSSTYRRSDGSDDIGSLQLSGENMAYYETKIWPLAIVLYGVDQELRDTPAFETLQYAMTLIQLETCIVFQEVTDDTLIKPKMMMWFAKDGKEVPTLGKPDETETVNLTAMVYGAAGHTAHVLNNLMRVLGVGMMSNRFDRDNYILINWNNIKLGYEHYFEKLPKEAWLVHIPYDFESVTHAPANYMCDNCDLGETTVYPIQDHLWQRILTMGHKKELSNSDVKLLNILYSKQCKNRYLGDDK